MQGFSRGSFEGTVMGRDAHHATGIPMDAYGEMTALYPPVVIPSHAPRGLEANPKRLFWPSADVR